MIIRTKYNILHTYSKMIREIFTITPLRSSLFAFADIIHAGSYVLLMISMQYFFQNALYGQNNLKLFESILCMLVSLVFSQIFNGITKWSVLYLDPKILNQMYTNIQKKVASMPAIAFEDAKVLDLLEKCNAGLENGLFAALMMMKVFTFYLPYFIFLTIYLGQLSPMLILTLIFVFIPVILSQYIRTKIFIKSEENYAPLKRQAKYYENCICDRKYFKETRLLGAYFFFFDKLKSSLSDIQDLNIKNEKKSNYFEILSKMITVTGYIGIIGVLVYQLMLGKIEVSSFAAILGGIDMMYSLANEVFGGVLKNLTTKVSKIYYYQKFLLEDFKINTKEWRHSNLCLSSLLKHEANVEDIVFNRVSFMYPNTNKFTLNDISVTIKKGETIALVGENGAGKSTFVKLLLRLYEPTKGEVENPYRVSAVFQDFQKYKMTLSNNIEISDFGNRLNKPESALRNAGFYETNSSNQISLSTMLSVENGGIDLSGGQWQRVSVARGLHRESELIVLDEPTSALDPIEESRVYEQFQKISKNKTTVLVTHRLGAAKIANRIIVFKDGKIDDIGTHEMLLSKGGYYTKLYHKQAKWYQ